MQMLGQHLWCVMVKEAQPKLPTISHDYLDYCQCYVEQMLLGFPFVQEAS